MGDFLISGVKILCSVTQVSSPPPSGHGADAAQGTGLKRVDAWYKSILDN